MTYDLNFIIYFHYEAVSPGLVESDIVKENANDELVSIMPALVPKDVAAAVIYAISVKPHVQVRIIIRNN